MPQVGKIFSSHSWGHFLKVALLGALLAGRIAGGSDSGRREGSSGRRLPMPTDADVSRATKATHEVTASLVASAHSPADRLAVSSQLLTTARDTADPAEKFLLMREAERLAVDAGDVEASVEAHAAITAAFDLGGSRAAIEIFQKLSRQTLSVGDAQRLYSAMLAAAADTLAGDHFDTARQIARLASSPARILKDPSADSGLKSFLLTIAAAESQQRKIAPALATLSTHPEDPPANAEVGRYRCFVKGDWETGVPMLARSNDDALKTLAAKELSGPTSPGDESAVADGWWDYSETLADPAKSLVRQHAGRWYADASKGLGGLAKLKADKRAQEYLKAQTAEATATPGRPAGARRGARPFTSALQVLQTLPANLFPDNLAAWDEEHQRVVNDALEFKVVGHEAVFNLLVQQVTRGTNGSLGITYADEPIGQFTANFTTSLRSGEGDPFAAMVGGATYTVSARISYAAFRGPQLSFGLTSCRILTPDERAAEANNPGDGQEQSEYLNIEEVLAAIPMDLIPKTPEDWRKPAIRDPFTKRYVKNFDFKTVTAKITLQNSTKARTVPQFESQKFPLGAGHFVLRVLFDPTDPAAANLKAGDTVTLIGKVSSMGWGSDEISLSLRKARVVPGK